MRKIVKHRPNKGWYVTAYELDRHYGGPQEGGWWYDTGTVVDQVHVRHYREAERLARQWRTGKWRSGDRYFNNLYSVAYTGGAYSVRISRTPGEDWSDWRFWE